MKKYKTDYLGNIYWSDWDGETFGKFKEYINGLDIPDDATLDSDYETTGVSIELRREETDEEYEKRLVVEAESREKYNKIAQEKELAEYIRLKAKYE